MRIDSSIVVVGGAVQINLVKVVRDDDLKECFPLFIAEEEDSTTVGIIRRIGPTTTHRDAISSESEVVFDIVAFQRSLQFPFQRNSKLVPDFNHFVVNFR